MPIKLETNEPNLIFAPLQARDSTLVSDTVDKKPVIVIRANETQLTTLNASFAKTALPNRAEMDEICKKTGLTSKWIRSWYGRKRRNQRKALGILAIKTEVGDPMISASPAGTAPVIQPQARPIRPAKETIPVAAKVTKVSDAGSLNTLRPSRTHSALSRRYAPYTNSKTVIASTTSIPSDDFQPHPSNKLQDDQPSTELRHSDSIANDNIPSPLVPINDNEGSAMSRLQHYDSNSLYAVSAYPDGFSSFSYAAAYNPENYNIHEPPPSSINLLPDFDMINANTMQNYHINDNMPMCIPTPVQYVHTSYGPTINTRLMDDSAFVSFARGSEEGIVIDVARSSEFQQHLSHSLTDMNIDMDHHSSHGRAPFAHLRQEEEEERSLPQATGEMEINVGIPPSTDDFSAFETLLKAPIHQLQPVSPKSQFTFASSDTQSTQSRFPATPMCIHAPTLEINYGTTPDKFSPPSRSSSLHQYETDISLSPRQQHPSIHTPALTPKKSTPNDIDDINSELRSSGSDLVSLTLQALATEEDTFTAAIMLVVLSKAGFIWDY